MDIVQDNRLMKMSASKRRESLRDLLQTRDDATLKLFVNQIPSETLIHYISPAWFITGLANYRDTLVEIFGMSCCQIILLRFEDGPCHYKLRLAVWHYCNIEIATNLFSICSKFRGGFWGRVKLDKLIQHSEYVETYFGFGLSKERFYVEMMLRNQTPVHDPKSLEPAQLRAIMKKVPITQWDSWFRNQIKQLQYNDIKTLESRYTQVYEEALRICGPDKNKR